MTDPEQGAAPRMPGVGEMAPDFTLPDDTGTPRSLRDQRGSWLVLWFYPQDDTSGCTTEACGFRDADRNYRELGAEIWGVSKLGVGSKAAFKAKFGLPFTLLADEDHEVSRRYGTWVLKNNYGKVSEGIQRATFLLDPEGRVARAWPRVKPEGHADEVLAAIRELEGKPAAA
jgi:thioredoxin-dependent peroxiredoxin